MNWGKWIVVAFVLFAGFIATLVTVCVRQDISLVSKDYYKEELAYQDQMLRIQNVSQLQRKPIIAAIDGEVIISFESFADIKLGELKLFRPSDARLDRTYPLASSTAASQHFDVSQLPHGMYKARMKWEMNGKEYFLEQIINL
jgi:hypothetical protein